ncbi:ABC transporter substrate-binding protein [Bacillus timonensis]|uniref:ABC transporter substrate-binding protein n=1 Tax=Bacillus timonensis TaxID=1033734 RepID=UPI0005AB5361|nr:ABC transporter substrate-binding protein [Bacillus timonensis]
MNLIAIITVILVVLAGCSGGGAGTSSEPTDTNKNTTKEPTQGGEFTFALATNPDNLDPHQAGYAVSVRAFRTMFDSLVVQNEDNTISPWLATEWSISDDGKSYEFKLREDVKFHDGTPFNAEAVKYNFDRIVSPDIQPGYARYLLVEYDSSEVIDEYTVKINLKSPNSAFLSFLSQAFIGMVSPTAAEAAGDQFGMKPVGTGPFKFVDWQENAQLVVEKNPDYNWGPAGIVDNVGPAHVDKITFKIIPEEATRIGSVQSAQVLAGETVPPQNVLSMKNDPNVELLQVDTKGLPYTLFFNQTRGVWSDAKAREAIKYALDIDAIVQTLYFGTYTRAWSPLAPGMLGYDESLEGSFKRDLDRANQLLDELGYKMGSDGVRVKDGKKLTMQYLDASPNREKRNDIAIMVQQQLKEIGVEVNIEITQDITTAITNSNYDVYGNSAVNSDSHGLYQFYHSPIPNQIFLPGKSDDKELDSLLEQGGIEQDLAKREEIYKQAQQRIMDTTVSIPIYVFPYTVAAHKSVEGIKFDRLGYPLFNDVSVSK